MLSKSYICIITNALSIYLFEFENKIKKKKKKNECLYDEWPLLKLGKLSCLDGVYVSSAILDQLLWN